MKMASPHKAQWRTARVHPIQLAYNLRFSQVPPSVIVRNSPPGLLRSQETLLAASCVVCRITLCQVTRTLTSVRFPSFVLVKDSTF